MVNNDLLGDIPTMRKNDGVRQWEQWHPIVSLKKVWNQQPEYLVIGWCDGISMDQLTIICIWFVMMFYGFDTGTNQLGWMGCRGFI